MLLHQQNRNVLKIDLMIRTYLHVHESQCIEHEKPNPRMSLDIYEKHMHLSLLTPYIVYEIKFYTLNIHFRLSKKINEINDKANIIPKYLLVNQ